MLFHVTLGTIKDNQIKCTCLFPLQCLCGMRENCVFVERLQAISIPNKECYCLGLLCVLRKLDHAKCSNTQLTTQRCAAEVTKQPTIIGN